MGKKRVLGRPGVCEPQRSSSSRSPRETSSGFVLSRSSWSCLCLDLRPAIMPGNPNSTVYVGNLDERVTDRVLYDILIQAGRVVDLYIPKDKDTDRPKGYAFAEYETEEIAEYAVRLFSGLVTLYNRTLKFAMSGQDKSSPNLTTAAATPLSSPSFQQMPRPLLSEYVEISQRSMKLSMSSRLAATPINNDQEPPPPGVSHRSSGNMIHLGSNGYDFSRRVFGATMESTNHSRSGRYDTSSPITFPSY